MYYFGARYYDARLGRFTSADPVSLLRGVNADGVATDNLAILLLNPQAWNLYSYAFNNPFRYVDPTGKLSEEWKQRIKNAGNFSLGYFTGAKDTFSETISSIIQTSIHPYDTAKSLIEAVPFILEIAGGIIDEYFQRAEELQSDDYYKSGYAAGKTITEVLLVFTAAKGIKKLKEFAGFSSISKKIASGHAWSKHRYQFPEIKSKKEFSKFIKKIMMNPSDSKILKDGRMGFWDEQSGTVVIYDPKNADLGTAFKPENKKQYFNENLK